ncbi:MAG: FAD-dependent oxidoreductase [Gemmatimonas sp.]|nr:FAD-dependent oxidoreductase [Gemmatimonas sp.]
MDRRKFIKAAGIQAGALLAARESADASNRAPSKIRTRASIPEVVVVGAGAFGLWTAYHLQRLGHQVALVDLYGPGNSRATSADETRGIRTGYGENELWSRWAKVAVERWQAWDVEWGTTMFTRTGDICMRAEWDGFLANTTATWDKVGVRYERVSADEIRYRYPQINVDAFTVGVYEPDAGVAKARYACLTLADRFRELGGAITIGHADLGDRTSDRLDSIALRPGGSLSAQTFIFAVGPWFPKLMPDLMGGKIRIPMGHVYYYGAPPGDLRFNAPNCPSYNFPGVTGWPILDHDSRGFRVRTGGRQGDDPDTSVRWIDEQYHEPARRILIDHFPDLADAPLLETRCCHYELSSSNNFIIDQHPEFSNVWIAGGGSAEGFKFGPVLGPYIANRVTGREDDPELADTFRIPSE